MSHVQKVPSSESSTLGCAVSMMRVHGMLSFGPTSRAKATMATLPLSTSAYLQVSIQMSEQSVL